MRRKVVAVSVAALSLGVSLLGGSPANAVEPTCHITATMPAETVLKPRTAGNLTFYVTLSSTPAGCFDVSAHYPFDTKIDGGGVDTDRTYLGQGVYKVTYGFGWLVGDYSVLQLSGYNGGSVWYGDDSWISDDSATMTIRDQAYASTKVAAKGHSRVVTGTASHYTWAGYHDGRVAWERTTVQLQQLRHGAWVTLKSGHTNANGQLKVKVRTGQGSFRTVIVPASDAIGTAAMSSVVTR